MKYKLITPEDGKQIAVDESKISTNDYWFSLKAGVISKCNDVLIAKHLNEYKNALKIIASNFYIDKSIPMWKDEVEVLAEKYSLGEHKSKWGEIVRDAFKAGYKANTKQYTEEQVIKVLIDFAKWLYKNRYSDWSYEQLFGQFIYDNPLQPQTIEFEMEGGYDITTFMVTEKYRKLIKTTTDANGQLWCNVKEIK